MVFPILTLQGIIYDVFFHNDPFPYLLSARIPSPENNQIIFSNLNLINHLWTIIDNKILKRHDAQEDKNYQLSQQNSLFKL